MIGAKLLAVFIIFFSVVALVFTTAAYSIANAKIEEISKAISDAIAPLESLGTQFGMSMFSGLTEKIAEMKKLLVPVFALVFFQEIMNLLIGVTLLLVAIGVEKRVKAEVAEKG